MKKALAVLLIFAVVAALLTACGSHPLVGTWTTTIEGAEGQMTLRRDGTGEIVSHGETRPCTWTVAEDNTLTVVQEIEYLPYTFLDKVSYTVKGRTLTVTSQKGNTLVFEKE